MLSVAMAGALPQQPGYIPANSAGGQYVGGPGQPQVPAMGHPGTAGHVHGTPGHHQPGPNEASLAELISFD